MNNTILETDNFNNRLWEQIDIASIEYRQTLIKLCHQQYEKALQKPLSEEDVWELLLSRLEDYTVSNLLSSQ